jgi:MFS family permease
MSHPEGEGRQQQQEAARNAGRRDEGFALSRSEEKEVEKKLPPSVQVLHETIRIQGDQEMSRSTAALAWSSLAAGLTMGFSMLVPGLLHAHLPDVPARFLIARLGYAVAFVIWTLAHIAHGGVHSVTQFAMVRFGLGIGEAGNFPAGIKAVTEWFPVKERAFAIGLFNAGANIGAIVTPLVVPFLVVAYGWRAAFVITGIATSVWVIAWLAMYRRPREHKRVSAAELSYIEQDPVDPVTPLTPVRDRQSA